MCIGVPVKVVEPGEFTAVCRGRNGLQQVNMMLTGPQPAGTWVLNFLGSARQVLTWKEAAQIDLALEALEAVMEGAESVDIERYFPGLNGTVVS